MNTQKTKFLIDFLYYALIICFCFFLLKYALPYFAPFILAYVTAASVQPVIRKLTAKCKVKQKIIGIISVILVWILLAVIAGIIIYIILRQTQGFLNNTDTLTRLISNVSDLLSKLADKVYSWVPNVSSEIFNKAISNISNSIISFATSLASTTVSFITNIFKATPSVIIFILVSFLASVFISADFDKIHRFVYTYIPVKYRAKCNTVKNFFIGTAFKLLKAYLLIMLITFGELIIGLSVIGVKYVFLLSVLIAIFDILPYVGSGTVLFPWAVIELFSQNYAKGIGILILAVIITVARNFLEPKLIGKETNTPPLLILISVYIGGKLLGIVGILFFPITIIILVKLYKSGYINIKKETA